MSKTLVIFGATGNQGGSVASFVLSDPQLSKEYNVRAVTRNASSPAAQALAARGASIVEADMTLPSSVATAVAGAHTVFGITFTDYASPTMYAKELGEGKTQADAAVAAGAQWLVFSTLPSVSRNSGGRFKNSSFDAKADVEAYIRTLPIRSAFFAPASFMANFKDIMAPRPSHAGDGTFAWSGVAAPGSQLPLIDIPSDTGKFVGAILADPQAFEGKVLAGAQKLYTLEHIVRLMGEATGKTVRYQQVPVDVFKGFMGGSMGEEVVNMLLYFQDFGYYGEGTPATVDWSARRARGTLTSFEDWLAANKLPI